MFHFLLIRIYPHLQDTPTLMTPLIYLSPKKGTITSDLLSISSIFFVPNFSVNFLSVSQLAQDGLWFPSSHSGVLCKIYQPGGGLGQGIDQRGYSFLIFSARLIHIVATDQLSSFSLSHFGLRHFSVNNLKQVILSSVLILRIYQIV